MPCFFKPDGEGMRLSDSPATSNYKLLSFCLMNNLWMTLWVEISEDEGKVAMKLRVGEREREKAGESRAQRKHQKPIV